MNNASMEAELRRLNMKPEKTSDDSPNRSTIDRFFSGLSEYIFQSKLGVADVQLIDYLSDMMLRFIRIESLNRVRRSNGRPATELFQMLSEAEKRIGLAKRDVHRHIGDVTLFWSGMYPERLRRLRPERSPDGFLDYCKQGKRAYAIAAEIEGDANRPSSDLLHQLSSEFEMCAYGLREVRREWERGPSDGGPLLIS
jgi:hypothetical protein